MNWVFNSAAPVPVICGPFYGASSGSLWDFSGYSATLSFFQYGQPPAALQLTSVAGQNGVVQLNAAGPGYVRVAPTLAGMGVLFAIASLFSHFLKVTYVDGTEYPLVVGASMVAPGM